MLSNNITLEQVPQIVASLEQKVDRLVNLVLELKDAKGNTPDEWMDVEGLMAYHPDKPARKTIYEESGSVSSVPRLTPGLPAAITRPRTRCRKRP